MKFQVRWSKSASDDLAEIWMASDQRQAVSDASNEIDKLLAKDADQIGESRDDRGERVLFASPLGVRFLVNQLDAVVQVLQVWKVRRK